MQWLIDIIKEWLVINHGYINRGDNAAFDFQIGDFTKDNAWHLLTLPAIVPLNTRAVHLYVQLRADLINKSIWFKHPDVANDINVFGNWTQVATIRIGFNVIVQMDGTTRTIRYLASAAGLTGLNVTVKGWWL